MGIGLNLVKKIIENTCGGKIEVKVVKNKTIFTIELPQVIRY
jgi:nitrogen-specific signal transduction histidine kinase